jgi:DNA polymerase III alpha subunit
MIDLISSDKKQYKANLHCHSVLSDGCRTPEELKEMYRSRGYDILAITDHERPFQHQSLAEKDFIMLTGYECYIRPDPAGKYNVLILRDSFATALLPYMGNSFENITAFWTTYELPARYIKEFEESDIIIFECVERLLPCMLNGIHITRLNLARGVK